MDIVIATVVASFIVSALFIVERLRRLNDPADRTVRRDGRNLGNPVDQKTLVEAIASWTENLRDAVSGASGIEQAIIATSKYPPGALRNQVEQLAASLRYQSLSDSLRDFADDVDHPVCDFVVLALIAASEHQARDLAQLLTHLGECARAECDAYLRIWVSRARSRSSVRIIKWSVVLFIAGLVVFNGDYLEPFASVQGLVVAGAVVGTFAFAWVWLRQLAEIRVPARLLAARS